MTSIGSNAVPTRPLPLGSRHLLASDDAQDVRDVVNGLTEDDHRLLPPPSGRVQGIVNGLKIGDVSLVFVAYGAKVTVTSPPSGRRTMLVLPLGPMGVECGGHEWVAKRPFALDGTRPTLMAPDGERGCLVGSVDAGALESLLVSTYGRNLANPILISTHEPLQLAAPDVVRSSWLGVVRQIDSQPAGRNPLLDYGLASVLMTSMLTGLSPYIRDVLEPEIGALGPSYVAAARAFIDSHSREDLGMEQVATAVGISARQLNAAFQEHLGTSPAQFLRRVRLEKARLAIEHERHSNTATVSSIAAESGFFHLGRFSEYYAQRYGEQPSETLRRVRSRT
ncbi:helix-turn-helix transcriptional regulator [Cryobacterium sp. TMT1-2-2]|uniref:AraC family transcriptional regulator n=1 Tax=Cryobacterium sp. TMT1-2-2 TaxID=1259233 RepID=UPI00141B6D2B|nr:helix-turn-helix transcriptional regulator [Cryobacterium sp. TMT1-2-2]